MLLSCHVRDSKWIHILKLTECQELLPRNRREISSLSDCNGIRTHNHLVRKRTLNYVTKLLCWVFVYELSDCRVESRCGHLNRFTFKVYFVVIFPGKICQNLLKYSEFWILTLLGNPAFGSLIFCKFGLELVNFSSVKAKFYKGAASVWLGDDSMKEKFGTLKYVAFWKLL